MSIGSHVKSKVLRIRVTLSPRCLALHVFKPLTSIVFTNQSSFLNTKASRNNPMRRQTIATSFQHFVQGP